MAQILAPRGFKNARRELFGERLAEQPRVGAVGDERLRQIDGGAVKQAFKLALRFAVKQGQQRRAVVAGDVQPSRRLV